jgi:hypothetical protein
MNQISIVPIFVRDAVAGLMIDDVADAESFQALDQWEPILRETSVVIHTVRNKTDLIEKSVHSQCRSGNRNS